MRHCCHALITALLILILTVACRDSAVDRRLADAERLMDQHPDSALGILGSIDTLLFRDPCQRAMYGMLMTQAMDKNHLNPTDGNLISYAEEYFGKHGDPVRHMISTYYHGRVHHHNKDYTSAQASFFKAAGMAQARDEYFWAGMACRGIADMYNIAHNAAGQLTYAQKQYEYTRKSGRQPYINYAMNDLGIAYYANDCYDTAVRISNQLLDSAERYRDPLLRYYALNLLGGCLTAQEKWPLVAKAMQEAYATGYAENRDSIYMCLALIGMGQFERAHAAIDSVNPRKEPGPYAYTRYMYFKNTGDIETAFAELEKVQEASVELYSATVQSDLNGVVGSYFEAEHKLGQSQVRELRDIIWIISILAVMVLLSMISVVRVLHTRKQRIIDSKIRLAEQLQESLKNLQDENTESSNIIRVLLANQSDILNNMSQVAMDSGDPKTIHKRIVSITTKLIDDLSNTETIEAIEYEVNKRYDNIFADFRNDFPALKEADYRLVLFTIMNLPCSTISFLLGEKQVTAVYNRKRRLKERIKKDEPRNMERYLAML